MAIVLITGGTGLIGRALTRALRAEGHEVRILGRRAGTSEGAPILTWEPSRNTMDRSTLEGVEHIVHLAGAGIADKRWTAARVKVLIDSRAASALLLLGETMAQGLRPSSFVSAAGINYYGAVTNDHVFHEDDPPGKDTIGWISSEWEAAVDTWADHCRTVKLRTPIVLASEGGALPKLAAPVRWGLGAALGTGRQWMPWVHIDDLVRIYMKALFDPGMHGPYNVDSGHYVRNVDMMRAISKALGRPFLLPAIPGWILRSAMGDLSSILLEGSRTTNARLRGAGYVFKHTDLDKALADLLQRR